MMHPLNEHHHHMMGAFDPMRMYHHHHHHQQPPKPKLLFKVPPVVADQKKKFESDELLMKLSRESEVRYTGFRDRSKDERKLRFGSACREGFTDIAFTNTGTNLSLVFAPANATYKSDNQCDFDKEAGKVHIRSTFIFNGVCVRWKGWIDCERLDGVGCLELAS